MDVLMMNKRKGPAITDRWEGEAWSYLLTLPPGDIG